IPGTTPPTSQLDWLSSTTAMIVLFWSRATRDLLKSFGWGIAATPSVRCSDEVATFPRRPPHSIFRFRGRRPASLERADAIGKRGGCSAARRRHTEDLRRRRHLIVHAGHAMRAQHHPHLLQHVAVVVDARLIDPDRSGDPGGLELVEGGDTRTQPKIR